MPNMDISTCLQKLGSVLRFSKKILCSTESVRVDEKGLFGRTSFLDIPKRPQCSTNDVRVGDKDPFKRVFSVSVT